MRSLLLRCFLCPELVLPASTPLSRRVGLVGDLGESGVKRALIVASLPVLLRAEIGRSSWALGELKGCEECRRRRRFLSSRKAFRAVGESPPSPSSSWTPGSWSGSSTRVFSVTVSAMVDSGTPATTPAATPTAISSTGRGWSVESSLGFGASIFSSSA